jgi:hypothetical protein
MKIDTPRDPQFLGCFERVQTDQATISRVVRLVLKAARILDAICELVLKGGVVIG